MIDLNDLTLAELIEAGARNEFIAGAGMLTTPALASDDAQREFARILFAEPRFQHPQATFGRNARKVVVHRIVAKRDPEMLAMLDGIAKDPTHPLATEALEELLATRDRAIIAPLYAEFVPAVLDEAVEEALVGAGPEGRGPRAGCERRGRDRRARGPCQEEGGAAKEGHLRKDVDLLVTGRGDSPTLSGSGSNMARSARKRRSPCP